MSKRKKNSIPSMLLVGAAAVCLGLPAHAAERATLLNGFSLTYDHQRMVAGRVRLYISKDEDSYVDLKPEEIASVDMVPDPPPDVISDATDAASPVLLTSLTNPGNAMKGSSKNGALRPIDLHEMLSNAGHVHNLDVDLLASVVQTESGGNAHAVSRTGARGLMQLMPGTAAGLGVEDSFEPEQNVRGGSSYLDSLLIRYKDNISLALAAYNAGPAAVDRYRGIPPYRETQDYVARVIHEFNRRVRMREALLRKQQTTALAEGRKQ